MVVQVGLWVVGTAGGKAVGMNTLSSGRSSTSSNTGKYEVGSSFLRMGGRIAVLVGLAAAALFLILLTL